jgi:LacI family transcriptional regulator
VFCYTVPLFKNQESPLKVKLEDVAREAGVSIATVSRVLNNHPVKEATRILVEETIARLDYRPNLTARGLIKGTSNRIGVIISNMENPYFSSIMNNMEIRLREEGYLCNFSSAVSRSNMEREILAQHLDSGVDGIILVDVTSRNENMGLYADLNQSIPVVLINGNPDRHDVSQVIVDQERGMELAMDYLLSLNHKRIAYLRGPKDSYSFEIKEKVYREKLEAAGVEIDPSLIVMMDDADHFSAIETARDIMIPVLKRSDRPTAVFTANEVTGLGVINAARTLKLDIPADLSVMGHDNTYLSRISSPFMTTVDLFPSRLGFEAAEMMLQLLRQDNPYPRRLMFNPELVIRESCRAL